MNCIFVTNPFECEAFILQKVHFYREPFLLGDITLIEIKRNIVIQDVNIAMELGSSTFSGTTSLLTMTSISSWFIAMAAVSIIQIQKHLQYYVFSRFSGLDLVHLAINFPVIIFTEINKSSWNERYLPNVHTSHYYYENTQKQIINFFLFYQSPDMPTFLRRKMAVNAEKKLLNSSAHISLKYNYNDSAEKNKKEKLTSFLDISFHYSWQKGVNTQQNVVNCLETLKSCTYVHMWKRFHG